MPFSMGTNIFGPSKTKDQKRKQKFTNKEGVGPREVALRATSPDP